MELRSETPTVISQNEEHSLQRVIEGKSAAEREMLDPRTVASLEKSRALANLAGYLIHSSNEFRFGKVFKVLWSEPMGAKCLDVSFLTMERSGTAFHKIRRLVVVRNGGRGAVCM